MVFLVPGFSSHQVNYGSAFCLHAGVSAVETLLKEQSKAVFSKAGLEMRVVASSGFSWVSGTLQPFQLRGTFSSSNVKVEIAADELPSMNWHALTEVRRALPSSSS